MRSLQAALTAGASGNIRDFFNTFSKVASRREPLQAGRQANTQAAGHAVCCGMSGQAGRCHQMAWGQSEVEGLAWCQAPGRADARPLLRCHTWPGAAGIAALRPKLPHLKGVVP